MIVVYVDASRNQKMCDCGFQCHREAECSTTENIRRYKFTWFLFTHAPITYVGLTCVHFIPPFIVVDESTDFFNGGECFQG